MTHSSSLSVICGLFFFKQKTAYEMRISDWSSDVCSSDLSFAATVVVNQLARAQTSYSGVVADKTAAIGAGMMTLTVGGVAKTITIDAANNSLDGLAGAINASGAGVTASIIADEGGHRLILKGPTGEAGAFTLTADAGADPGLSTFDRKSTRLNSSHQCASR